jgi:hypothetical protein
MAGTDVPNQMISGIDDLFICGRRWSPDIAPSRQTR